MSKLLIMSTQRTGSSALFYKYESNLVGYEPFNSEEYREEYKDIIRTDEYQNRMNDPVNYINYLFRTVHCVKFQMELVSRSVLLAVLRSKYRKILLYRNLREQYLSRRLAEETGQWWVAKGDTKIITKLDIEENDYERYREKMENLYIFVRNNIVNCVEEIEHEVHN